MEYFNKLFCLDVRGEYACFTRPEMKVERMSYDVITPSAARGVFEAVLWKPALRWRMRKIEVLNPIRRASVRRNEVAATMIPGGDGVFIEDKYKRQQKAGLLLADVAYRLHAELEFLPPGKRPKTFFATPDYLVDNEEREILARDENPGKYYAMFERRARKGQCFHRPYLGCREFACRFRLVEDPTAEPPPIAESSDLGFMLYDMNFSDPKNPSPVFFHAVMHNGVIDLPREKDLEVWR